MAMRAQIRVFRVPKRVGFTTPSQPLLSRRAVHSTRLLPSSSSSSLFSGRLARIQSQSPAQSRTMASTSTPSSQLRLRCAEGEDATQLESDVKSLVENGWMVDEEGVGVKKTFYFRGYFKAVSFVNLIAAESASKKHHSIMTVRIGSVDVYWTTHKPRGLTHKDISMARYCDNGAGLVGSVEEGQGMKCVPPVQGSSA